MGERGGGERGGDLGSTAATCSSCGQHAPARPLTWTMQVGGDGTRWLCDGCTRRDLRSLEARLDEAWW